MSNDEITGRLENWTHISGKVIYGNVYNDARERFPDGTFMRTSRIVSPLENLREGQVIITLNSRYLLGKKKMEDNDNE
jgi:hypothetical protein